MLSVVLCRRDGVKRDACPLQGHNQLCTYLTNMMFSVLFCSGGRTPEQLALVGAVADVAARAAFHHEDNKCQIVDSALTATVIGGLSPPLLPSGSDGSRAAPAALTASAVASEIEIRSLLNLLYMLSATS